MRDQIEWIEHAVEVTATSLYEAVALAGVRFRRANGWAICPPGSGCEFQVIEFHIPSDPLADSPSILLLQRIYVDPTTRQ